MLKPNWPGNFRRTIKTGKKGKEVARLVEFTANTPVELTAAEIEAIKSDIGAALVPIEFDEKARPRVITDDVSVAEEEVKADESKPAN